MAFSFDDAWDNGPEVTRAGTAAFGLYCRCGAWSARNLQDGFVPQEIAAAYGSPEWIQKLLVAGLWETCEGGYQMPHFLDRNPSAGAVQARRKSAARRQALVRDPALRQAVRDRDGDACRYCGTRVRWTDRKSVRGGTYDHVDPDGPLAVDNLVVSCRACSSRKAERTPSEAGMTLRPLNLDTTQNRSGTNLGSSQHHYPSPKGEEDARAHKARRAVENPGTDRTAREALRHPSEGCDHGDPQGPSHCPLCRRGIPAREEAS